MKIEKLRRGRSPLHLMRRQAMSKQQKNHPGRGTDYLHARVASKDWTKYYLNFLPGTHPALKIISGSQWRLPPDNGRHSHRAHKGFAGE